MSPYSEFDIVAPILDEAVPEPGGSLQVAAAGRSTSEPALASVEQVVPGKLLMYL